MKKFPLQVFPLLSTGLLAIGLLATGLLATSLLATGCALTKPPKDYHQTMNTWLGAPIDELLNSWGAPAYKFNLTDGRQQYHWDRLAAAVSPDTPDFGPGGRTESQPGLVTTGECGITVTVDPYHKVSAYSQPNPGCERMGLPRSREESL
ncbi:MAG: hypothetical protein LBR11_09770 [Deltaproteobacteria bacterium]|jgi:hypothetical protein|nr:hypothetical protein [Deltaproteobacteria bacterium]